MNLEALLEQLQAWGSGDTCPLQKSGKQSWAPLGFQGVWALKRPVGQAWAQAELDFGYEPGQSLRCWELGGDTGSAS